MTGPATAVYFLSDYGTADEFVGVVHAVLHRLAPGLAVIDLSHQVAPFDVAAGAALLVRSAPHLGPGVVLAVVDPGVGTARRPVAVAVAGQASPVGSAPLGADDHRGPGWLVGPDNGLLVPAAEALGGVVRVIDLGTGATGHRAAPTVGAGATFDGRDVFAPAAAHLATGGDPAILGSDVDPATLVPADRGGFVPAGHRAPSVGPSMVVTLVAWVDRFGNAQLRLGPGDLSTLGIPPGGAARVAVHDGPGGDAVDPGPWVPVRWVRAFGELEPGELGLITDANGSLALVLDRASAARHLGITGTGARVVITPDGAR